jgi:UDP-glucose 4-epimerase
MIGTDLTGKTCAIIGGGGFLGIHLARALRSHGAEVRAYGRSLYFPEALKDMHWMSGTLDELQKLAAFLDGTDCVFHLASTSTPASSEANRQQDVMNAVVGSLNLLDLCVKLGLERVVFASSGGTVYGNAGLAPFNEKTAPKPISTYGINKLSAEFYFQLFNRTSGMRNVVLRIANPFGPYQHVLKRQGVIPIFMRQALEGKPIKIWGDGSATRDYLFGADVANAMVRAAVYMGPDCVFNIGSGIGRSLSDIVGDLRGILDMDPNVEFLPSRSLDVPSSVLDCSLAARELGWRPTTPWAEALRETLRWTRDDIQTRNSL